VMTEERKKFQSRFSIMDKRRRQMRLSRGGLTCPPKTGPF
jgi:hypothetical protein